MSTMASLITSLPIVCSNLYSDADKKKTPKLRVTGLCAGNSPGTGEFPAQMASNAENVSIWWRHHVNEKNPSHQYGNPHYKDKTVSRSSYLYDDSPYPERRFLYWNATVFSSQVLAGLVRTWFQCSDHLLRAAICRGDATPTEIYGRVVDPFETRSKWPDCLPVGYIVDPLAGVCVWKRSLEREEYDHYYQHKYNTNIYIYIYI